MVFVKNALTPTRGEREKTELRVHPSSVQCSADPERKKKTRASARDSYHANVESNRAAKGREHLARKFRVEQLQR